MNPESLKDRLSRITTMWSVVFQAHAGTADTARAAQQSMLERYGGAIYRYLLGALRDPEAAEELCQEFALRFLRGDFKRADPERGRFRQYLKTALIHMVTDYARARQAAPRLLDSHIAVAAPSLESLDGDRAFAATWREEVLDQTWKALSEFNHVYQASLQLS